MIPRATYRLQLSSSVGFGEAAKLAGYLRELGVSDLYASPILMARPGSTHGYDVVDPGRLNPEYGGGEGFALMSAALQEHGLRFLLDFVPNHMAVNGRYNRFWMDVLAWGADSVYADWFDIDWQPDTVNLANRLLVPVLGNHYGIELAAGRLTLRFDEGDGTLAVWAYDAHKLPVCPMHYAQVWRGAAGERMSEPLERLGDALAHLPARHRAPDGAEQLLSELVRLVAQDRALREEIRRAVASFNGKPGELESWRKLDELIQMQHWRPAYFRVAADDINYRRFFNVNELAGIRLEKAAVFEYAHRLVFELIRDGRVNGMRIDHVDGLYDPKAYLEALRAQVEALAPGSRFYLTVEKILARHEGLREDWPIEGTTGYEFATQVTGLLVNREGEEPLTRAYREFTGQTADFAATLKDAKLQIIQNEMAGELHALARRAGAIARQSAQTMDFTEHVLERALRQIVACFPVYRTYVDASNEPAAEDRRDLQWAIEQAREADREMDQSVFDFLAALLTGDATRDGHYNFSPTEVFQFAMRFQQYTVPVMAKGMEDTAFYRYVRCFAFSEVGGRPDQFGVSLKAFHTANQQRGRRWPHTMLATSTHDTKLGEDARARLAVLTEIPAEWERHAQAWSRVLRAGMGGAEGGSPPSRADEYLFYQLLLATWPPELTPPNPLEPKAVTAYTERMTGAMIKAAREAKVHTSWFSPSEAYDSALAAFVERALHPERSSAFYSLFRPFQQRVADLAVTNSLVQTVIKLTVPGVPDIYQGSELWNLSLMDPDNRRPADFALRERLLKEWRQQPVATMAGWHSGAIKLHLHATLLRFRERHPELFAEGDYQQLAAEGAFAECVVAFLRQHGEQRLLVLCARYPAAREQSSWRDTRLPLPEGEMQMEWRDLLTGGRVPKARGAITASVAFQRLPVAVLVPADNWPPDSPGLRPPPAK